MKRVLLSLIAIQSVAFASSVPTTAATPAPASTQTQAPPATQNPEPAPTILWHAAGNDTWQVEGRAWVDEARSRYFDRLPAAAQGQVTDAVWNLSRDSPGLLFRFKTDAPSIWVDYKLRKPKLGMPHMPATGASGVDLYARDENDGGKWKWVNVSRPAKQEIKAELIKGLRPGTREYALYLPLFNGVETLAVGVPEGASFETLAPRTQNPIVFYGTSITHGASASRPGMVHTAILGRRLDRPVINLGFSGNGKMDEAVGTLLAKVKAAVFVIDCLPNMEATLVGQRAVPLVKQIRAAHPDTPIVLVEDRRFTNSWITPVKAKFHDDNHTALKAAYEQLQKEGLKKLFYIPGDALYGTDTEGATDASHASDLGFMRQADIFEPVLRQALEVSPGK